MTFRGMSMILAAIVGLGVVVFAICYILTLQKQRDGVAFIDALSNVNLGSTTREGFMNNMGRFKRYESSTAASACDQMTCYEGIGYGIDNSILSNYAVFPQTNLAAGVYFDRNNTVQWIIVSIDRKDAGITTIEELPQIASNQLDGRGILKGSAQKLHMTVNSGNRQMLRDLSVFCFTSWIRCGNTRELISSEFQP